MAELNESFAEALQGVVVDRPNKKIKNILLLGSKSKNGYGYPQATMESAKHFYEGRPVFLDHYDKAKSPRQRSVKDYGGKICDPQIKDGVLRGDLQCIGPHAEFLMDLAEASPDDVGMSHVVNARRSKDKQFVESIESVVSVDVVVFPATVASFQRESLEEEVELKEKLQGLLQGGDVLAVLKEVCEAVESPFDEKAFKLPEVEIKESITCESEQDLQKLAETRPWLAKRLETGEKAGKRELARKLITDHGKGLVVATEQIVETLSALEESAAKITVESMAKAIADAGGKPRSAPRDAKSVADIPLKDFIAQSRKGNSK